ncbi:lysine-specific demethylase 5B-B-like [Acropora millepora]|nr:lysine-specific demethylase 5B-B-like [Acropora millepora]
MWFEHLQSVQQNRKRGASKAAKTRKQRRLPKRRENQSSEVCQIFKSEDPDDDQEEIVWIQCDTCNLWYHQTCVIESWPPSLCPADDAIFWDCGSCKHHLRLTINHY